MKPLYALGSLFVSLPALAHEGHGLFGSHWHATDALGFVGVAAAAALAIWWLKK
jgi:Co/Zn/Cd efflux system component